MNNPIEHVKTRDGSSTLFSQQFQEHYHSLHGAIQESQHVFIKMGLVPCLQLREELSILEVGLGTGLNALLTLLYRSESKIHYHAIENYPLNKEQVEKLNYPDQLGNADCSTYLTKIHQAPWNLEVSLTPNFFLQKTHINLQDFQPQNSFHLVYFDAFAPNTQPELWTDEIFSKIYACCEPEAALVTYSSKGAVRRTLQAVGFEVEKLPGPPGKREMLRAWKK